MQSNKQTINVKDSLLTMKILFVALCASQIIFVALVAFDFIMPRSNDNQIFNFQYIGLIPALLSVLNFWFFNSDEKILTRSKKKVGKYSDLSTDNEHEKIAYIMTYQEGKMISWSLNEMIVITGLLGVLVSGVSFEQFLISFFCGFAMNLIMIPRISEQSLNQLMSQDYRASEPQPLN